MQDPAASLEAAARSLDAGRPAEARPALETAARQHPANGWIWALLARTYHQLQDPAKARQAAARAEPLAARDPRAQHTLALYHAQAGNRKRAAELERLYALSPMADPAAAARAALLSHETGLLAECIELGERALATFDRPPVRAALASCYQNHTASLLRAEQFTAAVTTLETARRRFPRDAQLTLNLGIAYYAQRRFEDAITQFLAVTELEPATPQPYWFLSRMLDQAGDRLPRIRQVCEAWSRSDPAGHLAPFVHAKVLLAQGGDRAAARTLFEESLRREPRYWESRFEYGLLLEQQGELDAAAKQLEMAIQLDAKQPAPYYRLARIHDRLGNQARAAELRKIHAGMSK